MVFMALGIVLTYSRSGLLAFILTLVICVWEYGVKGKRHYIVVATAVALVVGLGAALSTAHYSRPWRASFWEMSKAPATKALWRQGKGC